MSTILHFTQALNMWKLRVVKKIQVLVYIVRVQLTLLSVCVLYQDCPQRTDQRPFIRSLSTSFIDTPIPGLNIYQGELPVTLAKLQYLLLLR